MKPWKWFKSALRSVVRFWKRVPRGRKLALDLLALLLIPVLTWALLDFPSLSADMAYRRAVVDAGYPASEMELLFVPDSGLPMAIGTDGENTYGVILGRYPTLRLWQYFDVWALRAVDGIWYCDLRWDNLGGRDFPHFRDDSPALSYAVKAPGASAELTLTLDDWHYESTSPIRNSIDWHGGTYSFLLEEVRDGWFLFAFDQDLNLTQLESGETLEKNHYQYNAEMLESYVDWIKTYYSQTWMLPPAHLTLVTYDEIGAVLDTVTWDVEAVGAPNRGGGYTLH